MSERKSQNKAQDHVIEMGGMVLKPGDRLGAYVYERRIGKGGMADVLLAKDPGCWWWDV